ncbi:MAG: short-chain dehydrogenase, partial [Myxococcota bacterium]
PDRIAVTALNPGWVATDMGTPAAPLQPDQVAASLMGVLDSIGLADTGSFVDRRGKAVPW